jgi:predicted nucleic acid-binding protein
VPERWVVDASPLIALGSIRRLDLLTSLAEDIVVPQAVASEVLRVADEASRAFAERSFRTTAIEPDEAISRWGLGRGETAVLTFARSTPGYVAIIDDLSARRCAAALGISVRGTLGIVLLGKRRGVISSARATLEELRAAGLYLSSAVVAAALSLVDEDD